jgi:outer membrane protein
MRMTHRILILLILGIVSLPVGTGRAQPERALTADDSVRLALAHNSMLRAARADSAAAQAAYRQSRAARLPSFSTQASYLRLSDNIPEISLPADTLPGLGTTTFAPVELNQYYAEVAVEQPLFTGFRLTNQIRAARRLADAAAGDAAQEEADVAFQVRRAYWRLYQALAVREVTDEALGQVEAHLRDVRNRRDAGAALVSDVLAVQTRRSEVRLEGVEAANAVRVARLELNRLTGLPLAAEVRPVAEVTVESLPEEVAELVAHALDTRPALAALGARVEASDAEVAVTQGAWLPEVALNGRYIYARPNPYFFTEQDEFRGSWEAGVVLRWKLWDGGARQAETRQAQARSEGVRARLAAARETVAVEVMRQNLEVQRAAEAVAVAGENVEEAAETLRMVRLQYAEGASLSAQVLDAEQALRSARARRTQALADYAVARAALLNALGQVW